EAWLGGSTLAGSAVVDAMLRSLGLFDTTMYGGYETDDVRRLQAAIPIRIESQPAFGLGKYTTAFDLARLWRDVWLPPPGGGPPPPAVSGGVPPPPPAPR